MLTCPSCHRYAIRGAVRVLNQPIVTVDAVPSDFTEALNHDADARRFFDGLSYSNQRRVVLSIEDAKTAETRQRRIDKAVIMLREGRL